MGLSYEQLVRFYEQGYLVLENFLEKSVLEQLKQETQNYHVTLRQAPPGIHISWEPDHSGEPKIQQILHAEKLSTTLAELVGSAKALDTVESLLGPDIALFESKFLMKVSKRGSAIPWHQDFAYWASYTHRPFQVNCLIYIDDADESNGCLEVIPGTHRQGLIRHASMDQGSIFTHSLSQDFMQGHKTLRLPGKGGTAVLFGPLLMHASGPNTSNRDRRSLTIVYTVATEEDHQRQVLRYRSNLPSLGAFIPLSKIKKFSGPGPHRGQCAANYRRRELWRMGISLVDDPQLAWVEIGDADSDGESFEWFASRKPAATPLIRFEPFPVAHSNRKDAMVVQENPHAELLRKEHISGLGEKIGLLHIECDLYLPTQSALSALSSKILPGTVILFDRFYCYRHWQRHAALAWHEFVHSHKIGFEYLGRSDHQVALRVIGTQGISIGCARIEWSPRVQSLSFVQAPEDRLEEDFPQRNRSMPGQTSSPEGLPWFPIHRVPQFEGEGSRRCYCPTHARRRELWKYAVSLVQDSGWAWCEFGVGEGESLDWFALHKPEENALYGFDSFEGIPEPWGGHPIGQWKSLIYQPNRKDVVIVPGRFDETLRQRELLARLGPQIGLLHIDCDLYSSTKMVLDLLKDRIGPGTVLIFDEFYGYSGWQRNEAKAFLEFVQENGIFFEYIARSDFQVAVRMLPRESRSSYSIRPLNWVCSTLGVRISEPRQGSWKMRLKKVLRELAHRSGLLKRWRRLREAWGVLRGKACLPLMHSEEIEFLAFYASKAKRAVEIGTFCGGSACIISRALGQGARLVTIDPYIADSMMPELHGNFLISLLNVLRHGKIWKVRFIRGYSHEAARSWKQPIDFLWIDGSHFYEDVKRDFEAWSGFVAPGGYILFHDSNRKDLSSDEAWENGWCGPTRLCNEIKEKMSDRYRHVDFKGSINVFLKL